MADDKYSEIAANCQEKIEDLEDQIFDTKITAIEDIIDGSSNGDVMRMMAWVLGGVVSSEPCPGCRKGLMRDIRRLLSQAIKTHDKMAAEEAVADDAQAQAEAEVLAKDAPATVH